VRDQTSCSNRFAINEQHEGLWRPGAGHRGSNGITNRFKGLAGILPPLMPKPVGNRLYKVRPISYPDD
jgi:hypothetical protein